jgi:hypothetical protein
VLAFRLITILLLVYLVFLIIGVLLSSIRARSPKQNRIRSDADKEEELVLCIQCQSYVPNG